MRPAPSAAAAALCCLLVSTAARADPPKKSLQLTYTASGPGASTCPDEAALHKALLDQLGRDPLRPDAPYRLTAAITASFNRHGREFTAALQIEDAAGRVVWTENRLTTMAPCTTLVLAIGNAVAGWVHERPRPAEASPPAQPPTLSPPAPTPVSPPTAARRSPPAPPNASTRSRVVELRMGLDTLVNVGITPSPSIGAGYVFELRPIKAFSLGATARAGWTPVAATVRDIAVRSTYLSGAIIACGRALFLFACPMLGIGWLQFQGPSSAHVKTLSPVVVDFGVRAGIELSFARRFSAHVFTELKAVPTVTNLWTDDKDAWRTPSAFFSFGLGLSTML